MAKPMTHMQFVDLLKKWNIPYESNARGGKAWYNHNRNHVGNWGPHVYGIGNHHTGAKDNQAGADVLWNGVTNLPGPLCHGGIRTNGYVLLNGWGRTNHFGYGDDDVLDAVIEEKYSGTLKPNEGNTDGNRYFYGFEWMYDGLADPMTKYPKLYRTAVRVNAAICTFHNWKPESCIGHGEWQRGKWDPGHKRGYMMPMDRFRNHVEQAMQEGPNPPKPPTKPNPKPATKEIIIESGDTFYSLARKYYPGWDIGDAVYDIVQDNPQLLKPGTKLKIVK
jgi:hypothetical protein